MSCPEKARPRLLYGSPLGLITGRGEYFIKKGRHNLIESAGGMPVTERGDKRGEALLISRSDLPASHANPDSPDFLEITTWVVFFTFIYGRLKYKATPNDYLGFLDVHAFLPPDI